MTRNESKKLTIKKIGRAISGKEVAAAMMEHFKRFEYMALKEIKKKKEEFNLAEAITVFNEEALVGSKQALFKN